MQIQFKFAVCCLAVWLFFSTLAGAQSTIIVGTLDTITNVNSLTLTYSDSSAEKLRPLLYDSLITRDSSLDFVGELARSMEVSSNGRTFRFTLRDGIEFHNGRPLTSADVFYTFDRLFDSGSWKAGAFLELGPSRKTVRTISYSAPDPETFVITIVRTSLREQMLAAISAIPIIPNGGLGSLETARIGTGPFAFVSLDAGKGSVELSANPKYWDGPAKISRLTIRSFITTDLVADAMRSGAIDLLPYPDYVLPATLAEWSRHPDLQLHRSVGNNVQYLNFNIRSPVVRKLKIRHAIAYAIDRQEIVSRDVYGQANVANSILPERSWAHSPGHQYGFDPEKSKRLLKAARYKNEPIVLKIGSNPAVREMARAIEVMLKQVGINVRTEATELSSLRLQVSQGEFQMNMGMWVGGNQDPVFLKDLFATSKIPGGSVSCCNRSRYSSAIFDELIERAAAEVDRDKKRSLYVRAWELVSADLPLFPLWHPADLVLANKRIGNVKFGPARSWRFLKDVTAAQ